MKRTALENSINDKEVAIILTGGFVRLPKISDECFWADTRRVAEWFSLTPQRIRQLCNEEGFPKEGRNRFYIPDIVNWQKVKFFAELLKENPKNLELYGVVDFTLGKWWERKVSAKALSKILK